MLNRRHFIRTFSLLLATSPALLAQQQANKFEIFTVNGQKGIVEVATLKETLAPDAKNKTVDISNKYFLLLKGQDSVQPFNKQTGIWEATLPVVREQNTVYLNNENYLHVVSGKTGVLYDKDKQLKYRLPKLYTSFFSRHSNLPDNILIAELGKKAHVLQLKGDRFVLLHELEASSFSREVLEQSDGSTQKVYVLFGGANTYVFNEAFELIRTMNSPVSSDLYLDRLLNPNVQRYGSGEPRYAAVQNTDQSYQKTASDEQYLYYTATTGKWKINIRTNQHMKLEGKVDEMIWVYKENRTVSGGETTISYSTDHSYGFYLDNNGRKPLLPGKYAKEIGLQVLFIKQ